MNISGYDVIYNERIYKCIDFQMEFLKDHTYTECGLDSPEFISIVVVNEDGNISTLRDETWMFRFVRKEQKK